MAADGEGEACDNQAVSFFLRETDEAVMIAATAVSVVMIRSKRTWSVTGILGIIAGISTLSGDIIRLAFPAVSTAFLVVTGFLWVVWWILVARRLITEYRRG